RNRQDSLWGSPNTHFLQVSIWSSVANLGLFREASLSADQGFLTWEKSSSSSSLTVNIRIVRSPAPLPPDHLGPGSLAPNFGDHGPSDSARARARVPQRYAPSVVERTRRSSALLLTGHVSLSLGGVACDDVNL